MRVLVLGGSGQVGTRLLKAMSATDWCDPVCASRGRHTPSAPSRNNIIVDTRDEVALTKALSSIDCVVNCIAGDAKSISDGARILARSASTAQCRKIIHLSTMSVYGRAEGAIDEASPLDPELGWYAKAKCEAEGYIQSYVENGCGQGVILRPGCVYGPGSDLWVGRIGRWLRSGRLGDIGVMGDGWSNLVHVDDVCAAVLASLRHEFEPRTVLRFNLAAPDSPRWNDYFVDLALAITATPVRRITKRQLKVDAYLASPLLKAVEKLLNRLRLHSTSLPDAIPPALLRFFSQNIQLDASLAERVLGIKWICYARGLENAAAWFNSEN